LHKLGTLSVNIHLPRCGLSMITNGTLLSGYKIRNKVFVL
jgi:hypothetical protein